MSEQLDKAIAAAPAAAACTCPSGDGSLRWPCPKHPPAQREQTAREWVEERFRKGQEAYWAERSAPPAALADAAALAQRLDKMLWRHADSMPKEAYFEVNAVMRALLAQQPAAPVPEGYALVPVEPTESMMQTGICWGGEGMGYYEARGRIATAWRYMVLSAKLGRSIRDDPEELAMLAAAERKGAES